MTENPEMNVREYKNIETRLYGELMKTCRRYTNELHLISILGILEIIKEEIQNIDKTSQKLTRRGDLPADGDDSASLDTIM